MISFYQYRKSHCGDKTVVKSSYLSNEISYAGKTGHIFILNQPQRMGCGQNLNP